MQLTTERKALLIVFFTVFIDLLGFGILIPVIPLLLADPSSPYYLLNPSQDLSYGYILLGFLTAIFPIGQFFAAPILGQLSDKYGRKKVLAFSLLGTSMSYIVFALAILTRNIPLLFASRFFDGMTGGNISVAQAAIADITKPEHRAKNFGLIGAAFGLGFIIGPFIGGKLSDPTVVGWFNASTPFWFAAILSFLNVLSVLFIFPETRKHISHHLSVDWSKSIHNILHATTLKQVRSIFLTSFLFQGGFTFFTTFFAVYLINRFNFSQGNIGDFFAYIGLWIAFAQIFLVRIVTNKFQERQILPFSILGVGIFILLYIFPTVWWQLLFIVPFMAIFNAFSSATLPALVSRSVSGEIQGEILGINASVQALAFAIPPIISGFVAAKLSPEATILVSGCIILISWVTFLLTNKRATTPQTIIG